MVRLILQYLQKSHFLTSAEQTSEQEFTSGSSLLHPRETETQFGIVFVFKSSSLQDWDLLEKATHTVLPSSTQRAGHSKCITTPGCSQLLKFLTPSQCKLSLFDHSLLLERKALLLALLCCPPTSSVTKPSLGPDSI